MRLGQCFEIKPTFLLRFRASQEADTWLRSVAPLFGITFRQPRQCRPGHELLDARPPFAHRESILLPMGRGS